MTTLTWKLEELPDHGRVIHLSGFITEEADFRPLVGLDWAAGTKLDLGGIEQINSCGVREWILFVRKLSAAERPFELVRCSPAVVRQLNTISNFRGAGSVSSVLLPYYCAACEQEDLRLLELPDSGAPPPIDEAVACPHCGDTTEFDDLPASYLAFVR